MIQHAATPRLAQQRASPNRLSSPPPKQQQQQQQQQQHSNDGGSPHHEQDDSAAQKLIKEMEQVLPPDVWHVRALACRVARKSTPTLDCVSKRSCVSLCLESQNVSMNMSVT